MKQKLLCFVMLGVLLIGSAYAQERRITGKVTSAEDGSPIPGVSVEVSGTAISVQTTDGGNYTINVPAGGQSLVFRYVGFATQTVAIGTSSIINVALELDQAELEEVIVTGYQTIRKSQFAGSASLLSAEAVENRPVGSFTQALQGRSPGVLVNSGSGQPGANATITIRGVQSIAGAGAQPLYVIDGIPSNPDDFYSLNPNDFETLTILKDANSAAMYGARGGVGVVLVTTKQGRNMGGGSTEIIAKAQLGYTMAPDFSRMNMMSTAELLEYQERVGLITGSTYSVPGWTWSRNNPANEGRPEAELLEMDRKLDSVRAINTDLRDVFFRTGRTQQYELGARGGNEKTRFFVSGSFFDQDGIDRTSSLTRYSGRVNLGHTANKLNVQWNTLGSYSQRNDAVGDLYGNSAINPFQMLYRSKPYDNPYREDGTLNYGPGGTQLNLKEVANVLERGQSTRDARKQMKLNTGLTLSYDILDNLQLRNVFGVDMSNTLRETYIDPGSYSGSVQNHQNGYAREANYIFSQLINTTSLNFTDVYADKHQVSAGVYFEGLRVREKGMGFILYNLNPALPWTGQGNSPLPTEGAATMPQNASSARSGFGIRSFFGNAEYTYDDRISVNANVRHDGTSRIFNEANREILTWSAGAIWNLDREAFFANQNLLSNLRLRASYGVVPNIGSIATTNYGINGFNVTNYAGNQLPAFGSSSYVGSAVPGLAPTAPGNPNLRIERIHKTNIGLDFGFWNDRANFVFDFYKNKTVDLFVRQPLSATTAFPNLDINAGVLTNKGVEGMVNLDLIRNTDSRLTFGWNHAININRIEDLGLVDEYFLGTFVIREGLPYGTHYTYHYLGADPQTGRPTYETQDGGTTTDFAEAGEFAKFGTYLPKHVGGMNLDFSYKGFSIGAIFSYQFDVVRSDNVRNWITNGGPGYIGLMNQSRELLTDQWMQPGDVKWHQSPQYQKNFTSSDLNDAKFLRFRALNVGYNIPAVNFSGKRYIKGVQLYANFHNLAIWSPWKGVDPEDNNNISLVEYPNPRMAVFGVDISF